MLAHPALTRRSCDDCKLWLYDDSGDGMGERTERAGVPCRRPSGAPTPCWKCPKIPKGVEPRPENARELDARTLRIYEHYLRCRAVGRFPRDAWVELHAAVIRGVEDDHRDGELVGTLRLLAAFVGCFSGKGRQ